MKKSLIILSVLLLQFCLNAQTSTSKDIVSLKFVSSNWTQNSLKLSYYIVNNTNEQIKIIRPRPILKRGYYSVQPEFFKLTVLPEEALCQYEFYQGDLLKNESDFLNIKAKDSIEIVINAHDFAKGICNKNIEEVIVLLEYKFDKRFKEKDFFYNYAASFSNISSEYKETLFNLFKKLYEEDIISSEIIVKRNY